MSFDTPIARAEDDPSYEGWRVVAASSVGVFVGFGSLLVYTFGIFLKPLAEEFAWSREAVSAAFGFAAVSIAVCSPLLGLLFDRLTPRRVILPCLTVFGCAFASLALLTPRLWHLYAVFTVLGMVGNGTAQMGYSRAVSTWFLRRRGLALAVVMSGGAVGAMVLPPAAQWLVKQIGWRDAALTLGVMVLVIGLPMVVGFIRERPVEAAGTDVRVEGASVGEGVMSRVFAILVVVLFISSLAQNGAITHLSALLTDRGVSPSDAAIALSAMGGASLLGRISTGWLLDRFFAGRVAFALLIVAALGTFVLSWAHSLAAGALGAMLIGFGMGGEADVTPYLLSRYFGLRSFSTLYGLTWTAYALAGAVGPMIMGRAFDMTGSYESLLGILALLVSGVAALMLLLPTYDSPGFLTRAVLATTTVNPSA
jgi:MFS family permease